jgi:putative SOS response-associated peptidase YedK
MKNSAKFSFTRPTRADRLIESIHDRMPVILDERTAGDWMMVNEIFPRQLLHLSHALGSLLTFDQVSG